MLTSTRRQPSIRPALDRAIERGWLVLHESGTRVRFTQAGADLRKEQGSVPKRTVY
jgi:hypothetical protein